MILDGKSPTGPIEKTWDKHRFEMKLVNPANKRKYKILVVGTGLAGASAAASLGELGYNVEAFCYQDSSRRAHSIAAQGGINAAKNYPNDNDSIWRQAGSLPDRRRRVDPISKSWTTIAFGRTAYTPDQEFLRRKYSSSIPVPILLFGQA